MHSARNSTRQNCYSVPVERLFFGEVRKTPGTVSLSRASGGLQSESKSGLWPVGLLTAEGLVPRNDRLVWLPRFLLGTLQSAIQVANRPFSAKVSVMRNALLCLASVVILSSAGLMATTMEQPPAEMRAQAKKFYDENNFNDALQLYRTLALDPENSGKEAPGDLAAAIACLNDLGLVHEADELIATSIETHKSNFRLLAGAAQAYSGEIEDGGFVIAGTFERGGHRGGGQWASVADRDRVRSLQLLLEAIALAEKRK